jgi:hypothetical protein
MTAAFRLFAAVFISAALSPWQFVRIHTEARPA